MAFIVFEGLDGSGKTSLMRELTKQLDGLNIAWVETREPGGTRLGDEIRELLLRQGSEIPHPRTELLLYEASRAQHVETFIRPNLGQKKWVLCDRYSASSLAFQGGGRAISTEEVIWLNRFATQGLQADLTILLDLSVEISMKRQKNRQIQTGQPADRIESENMAFHEKVRQSFLDQARQEPNRWLVLSAEKSPQELSLELHHELRLRRWLF